MHRRKDLSSAHLDKTAAASVTREKRRRREELGIKLPKPLKPWASVDTLSKKVIPYFEKGEHPLMVAKKLKANPDTIRSYWWRWRQSLGI